MPGRDRAVARVGHRSGRSRSSADVSGARYRVFVWPEWGAARRSQRRTDNRTREFRAQAGLLAVRHAFKADRPSWASVQSRKADREEATRITTARRIAPPTSAVIWPNATA